MMSNMEDFRSHDPEAVASFLAGQVRPSPHVPQIYKCRICFMEFPSAQAIGGHMTSHCNKRRVKTYESTSKEDEAKKAKSSNITSGSKEKKEGNYNSL